MHKANEIYRSRINQVIDYVTANIHQSISLEKLAEVACFSTFHFHRIFVAVTGETVKQFTNRIQNEKAARLLRFSHQSISTIADECGFSSPSTLSRQFQQYFQVSPVAYRKGAPIQNSKIRNNSQQANPYHCNITDSELDNMFPVTVKLFPERTVAYIRVVDAFQEGLVINAFSKLSAWAKAAGHYDTQTFFEMSIDDPDVTPKELYRYEACVTIPDDFEIQSRNQFLQLGIETMTIPRCRYAVKRAMGDLQTVASGINYLFDKWLINSEYECETLHGLEVFLDKETICNWENFDLELCIPVKRIKR